MLLRVFSCAQPEPVIHSSVDSRIFPRARKWYHGVHKRPAGAAFISRASIALASPRMKKYIAFGALVIALLVVPSFKPVSAAYEGTITTNAATEITASLAFLNQSFAHTGSDYGPTTLGFYWGTTSAMGSTITLPSGMYGGSTITNMYPLDGLSCGTTYYFQAYAHGAAGTDTGAVLNFSTPSCELPAVTTNAVTGLTATSAGISGSVDAEGTSYVTSTGYDWGTTTAMTSTPVTYPRTDSLVPATLTGLSCNTTYYFQAYAVNSSGTGRGAMQTFTTTACSGGPTVTTAAGSAPDGFDLHFNGSVSATHTTPVTVAGYKWGTTTSMTNTPVSITPAAGTSYSGTLPVGSVGPSNGVSCGTSYYFQAFATNASGTAYGSVMTVSTPTCAGPTFTSVPYADGITSSGASLAGTILSWGTYYGTPELIAVGYDWGTSPTSLTHHVSVVSAGGTPRYDVELPLADISGLSCGTTYYMTAYATNGQGYTGTSSVGRFTTTTCGYASVSTETPSLVLGGYETTTTSISFFGYVGGDDVATAGIKWGLTAAMTNTPIIAALPVGSGYIIGTATGLSCNTPYYYEAFATTSSGLTSYGISYEKSTLNCTPPTVSTSAATAITRFGATMNGALTGSSYVTAAGYNWGTTTALSGAPVLTTGTTAGPLGGGVLTGLACGTTYYYRAYGYRADVGAINGATMTFTTSACLAPTVTTAPATMITGSTAILNGAITDTGGVNATTEGFDYGTTTLHPTTTTGSFGTGAFSATVSGLSCNTTYNYSANATNSAHTATGSTMSFTTLPCSTGAGSTSVATGGSSIIAIGLPSVTTLPVTGATGSDGTTASVHGTLVAKGGSAVTSLGYKWGPTAAMTSTPISVASTTGFPLGSLPAGNLTGLTCGATYYYQAFARNSSGTATGAILSFNTTCLPTMTISTPYLVGSTYHVALYTATTGGGIVTSLILVSAEAIVTGEIITGSPFSLYDADSTLGPLACNTTYYYQGQITSNIGTNTTDMKSFTPPCTLSSSAVPGKSSALSSPVSSSSTSTSATTSTTSTSTSTSGSSLMSTAAKTTTTTTTTTTTPAAPSNTAATASPSATVTTTPTSTAAQPASSSTTSSPAVSTPAATKTTTAAPTPTPTTTTTTTPSSASAPTIKSSSVSSSALGASALDGLDEASLPASTSATTSTTAPTATSVAPYTFTQSLYYGATGADVTALQQYLATKGYFTQAPTGEYGRLTQSAVEDLQADNNLPVTGTVGPLTRQFLNAQ